MASKLNYVASLRNAKMDAITTAIGSAGTMQIRDGVQPAGPATGATGTLGATFTLGSPFGPASSGGVLSPTLPANVNGVATITQTWARILTSGSTAIVDLSAGTAGTDLVLSGTIVNGQPVAITSWSWTDQNAGH